MKCTDFISALISKVKWKLLWDHFENNWSIKYIINGKAKLINGLKCPDELQQHKIPFISS